MCFFLFFSSLLDKVHLHLSSYCKHQMEKCSVCAVVEKKLDSALPESVDQKLFLENDTSNSPYGQRKVLSSLRHLKQEKIEIH